MPRLVFVSLGNLANRAMGLCGAGRPRMEQEVQIGPLLRQRGATLASAESCTGGLIGHLVTNVPGSSYYYLGGVMDNEARIAIHMAHRIGAVVTTGYLLWLCLLLWRGPLSPVRRMAPVVGGVLVLQVVLGLSNVLFNFPLWVAVAHNAVGALLLVVLVTLNYYLFSAREAD